MASRLHVTSVLGFCLVLLAGASVLRTMAEAQGFGSTRKRVVLHRTLPPVAKLTGSTFTVVDDSPATQPEISQQITVAVAAELMKYDHALRETTDNPENIISFKVTQYIPPRTEISKRETYESNSNKLVTHTVEQYSAALTIAYAVKPGGRGALLDSENVVAKYQNEFDVGASGNLATNGILGSFGKSQHSTERPPTSSELQQQLIHTVAVQVASRLVPIEESIEVPLARGKLDEANKFAEAGLWSRYLDALETMTPIAPKEEDAYRLYNIGVGYEAVAYSSQDPDTALRYLQIASASYSLAHNRRPAENNFVTAQSRSEAALAHYRRSERGSESSSTSSGSTGTNSSSAAGPSNAGQRAALTNQQVIDMLKAGIDQDNMIDFIRTADAVDFDLSVTGQVNLAKSGVNGPVLMAMKSRARSATAASAGGSGKSDTPDLPWPPPAPSGSLVLSSVAFEETKTLGGISATLEKALDQNGYAEKSFYNVRPNGFAVATRMERIYEDGRPDPPPDRWNLDAASVRSLSLAEYIRALFTANVGYYRVIVFVVTDHPVSFTQSSMQPADARRLLASGANVPSPTTMQRPVSSDYVCTALIYEFKKEESKEAIELVPGHLDAKTHLLRSGLWAALGLPQP